ncbi:hypothetical protein FUAX_02210 [Fulvitalea axinellae]|uniref:Uncharacterized protein n=1 Tax=Fulvitalea axinellae TaxID=1182444 RepID=A0AAU9D057_9BACT|nr:hypothetical protein FUAX_02210 [Fulvitalea axinellae]
MDLDELKSHYRDGNENNQKSFEKLRNMMTKGTPPVLKAVKRQLIFESAVWVAILATFHNIFDGNLKPAYANALVIVAVVTLLIHNLLEYRSIQFPVSGNNLKESVSKYLKKVKAYAFSSISTRVFAYVSVMVFLFSGTSVTPQKLYLGGSALVLTCFIQVFLLRKVWHRKISKLEDIADGLKE